MLLLLAILICALATAMLALKASSGWYLFVAIPFLVLSITPNFLIDDLFVVENASFFLLATSIFVALSAYTYQNKKLQDSEGGVRQIFQARLSVAGALIFFGLIALPYITNNLELDVAYAVLHLYMGVLGSALFWRTWRLRKTRFSK